MANGMRLRWGLQPDQTHLTLAIFRGEVAVAQIDLPYESVLQAIRGLAELRQQMLQPEQMGQPAPEPPAPPVLNPLWAARADPAGQGVELMLRHPGFGVLGFQFPRAEAESLLRELKAALDGGDANKPN